MEVDIEELKNILGEINQITLNFRKCSKANKTLKYRESRLEKLSKLIQKYRIIYERLFSNVSDNDSLQKLFDEINETYVKAVALVENYAIVNSYAVESEFAHLTETVLTHLKENLSTNDFYSIQQLVDNYESDDQTGAELYRNLLDNLLSYYTRQEESLRQENTNLLLKINSQKELTTQLLLESDVSYVETQSQTELIEELRKEKSLLYKRIRKLEEERFEVDQNLDQSFTEKDRELVQKNKQILALEELLKETKAVHNKSIKALRLENINLQKLIVKLKLEKTNMADTLQDISKQVNSVIPTFSGEKNGHLITELNIFINTCQILFESLSQAGQVVFLKYISTRCRGDAYDLVTRRKFSTLKEFFKILTDSYLPLKSVRDFKEELHRCCQRPGENLTEYGDRLKRVLWDCIKCIETKYSDNNSAFIKEIEIEAIDVFRAGINNLSVRHYLLTIKTENLEEVIKEAIYFERVDNRYKKIDERSTPSHSETRIGCQFNHNPQPQISHLQQCNYHGGNLQQQYGLSGAHGMEHQSNQYINQERQFVNATYRAPNNYSFHQNNAALQYNNREAPRNFGFQRGYVQQYNQSIVTCQHCRRRGHTIGECKRRRNVCGRCGQAGHFQSDCGENTMGNGLAPAMSCLFCKRTSHNVTECEFKKQWEEMNRANNQNQGN